MVSGQLVILSDRALHLITDTQPPLVDMIQYHFRKSFEFLLRIVDCGLWLTVNIVMIPLDEGTPAVLMSAVTGCKLANLGWNKIEHQKHFFLNDICILIFRGLHENMISLMFHEKWFHTLVDYFNNVLCQVVRHWFAVRHGHISWGWHSRSDDTSGLSSEH